MRWLKFLIVLLFLGACGVAAIYYRISKPYAAFPKEVFVEIPKGASTRGIAAKLAGAGVVESPWAFLAARAFRRVKLQAGEYRFHTPASPLDVYSRIARGDVFFFELAIPEGLNLFDIAAVVDQAGLMPPAAFL